MKNARKRDKNMANNLVSLNGGLMKLHKYNLSARQKLHSDIILLHSIKEY